MKPPRADITCHYTKEPTRNMLCQLNAGMSLPFLRSLFSPSVPKIIHFSSQSDANCVLLFLKRLQIYLFVWYRNVYNRSSSKKWKVICQNINNIVLEWYKLRTFPVYSFLLAYNHLKFFLFLELFLALEKWTKMPTMKKINSKEASMEKKHIGLPPQAEHIRIHEKWGKKYFNPSTKFEHPGSFCSSVLCPWIDQNVSLHVIWTQTIPMAWQRLLGLL